MTIPTTVDSTVTMKTPKEELTERKLIARIFRYQSGLLTKASSKLKDGAAPDGYLLERLMTWNAVVKSILDAVASDGDV